MDEGNITIDGINIKKLSINELHSKISWVPQDPFIFSDTIRKNLLIGNPLVKEAELIEACKKSNIYDFINNLPDGFETLLGIKGIRLSNSQKQRISIARAILKNSEILLLDEATKALDSESESAIKTSLNQLIKNKTTIVIAHRLSTVLNADKIIFLNNGVIASQGNHLKLLNECDLYRKHSGLQLIDFPTNNVA